MPLSTQEHAALNAINLEALLRDIDSWVRVPSLNGSPEEVAIQEKLAQDFRDAGFEVDLWDYDYAGLKQHPSFSVEVPRNACLGVVASYGSDNGTQNLILNGHSDVVPAGDVDKWHYNPWQATLHQGLVYGRGALDMKGNLACAFHAMQALKRANIKLKSKVMLQAVMGEEDGGVGTLAAIARGYKAQGAIIMEPTELMLAPAQAGALNFRISITGHPAHGALRYEGVDPLEKFLMVYKALLDFEKERNTNITHPMFKDYPIAYPICVGTIAGGNWASTVAESLQFEGRYGVAINESVNHAKASMEAFIARLNQRDAWFTQHPIRLTWWGAQFAPAEISTKDPIVSTLSHAYKDIHQQEAIMRGMPYGADMRLLVNDAQTPTVMFGAGDIRKAHQFNEHVALKDLELLTQSLVIAMMRFCGVD